VASLCLLWQACVHAYSLDLSGHTFDGKPLDRIKFDSDWGINVEDRCTTIIVGKDAGTEGTMASHTADCADCDFRINKVPAMDWPEGTMRPLYRYKNQYPATVSSMRGTTWLPENLQGNEEQITAWGKESPVTAYIPQVGTYCCLCYCAVYYWCGV
jgi:hypothetical protein